MQRNPEIYTLTDLKTKREKLNSITVIVWEKNSHPFICITEPQHHPSPSYPTSDPFEMLTAEV